MKMVPTILVIKQKKSKKNVGEAVNNVKKVVNPMKWSW
ncbi:hypothetical protein SEVCU071_1529 [Staphylococcus epidermidis VCU071]|nr:hypothetical protein SEVCU071_1529 [Staphylococcus epidermidis VCU071]